MGLRLKKPCNVYIVWSSVAPLPQWLAWWDVGVTRVTRTVYLKSRLEYLRPWKTLWHSQKQSVVVFYFFYLTGGLNVIVGNLLLLCAFIAHTLDVLHPLNSVELHWTIYTSAERRGNFVPGSYEKLYDAEQFLRSERHHIITEAQAEIHSQVETRTLEWYYYCAVLSPELSLIFLLVKWNIFLNMIIFIQDSIYAFLWCMIPV